MEKAACSLKITLKCFTIAVMSCATIIKSCEDPDLIKSLLIKRPATPMPQAGSRKIFNFQHQSSTQCNCMETGSFKKLGAERTSILNKKFSTTQQSLEEQVAQLDNKINQLQQHAQEQQALLKILIQSRDKLIKLNEPQSNFLGSTYEFIRNHPLFSVELVGILIIVIIYSVSSL